MNVTNCNLKFGHKKQHTNSELLCRKHWKHIHVSRKSDWIFMIPTIYLQAKKYMII